MPVRLGRSNANVYSSSGGSLYKRRYYGRVNPRLIRIGNKRTVSKNKSLARKVAKLQKKVYNITQSCFKDKSIQLSGISSSGYTQFDWTAQGDIADGSERDERLGNKIVVRSLNLKFKVNYATGSVLSTSDQFNRVRMIVFVIKDINVTTPPGITDILQTNEVDSFYKKDSEVKYTILYDQLWNLQNPEWTVKTGAGDTPPSTIIGCQSCVYPPFKSVSTKINFPKGLPLHYKGAATSQPILNSIGIALISDSSAIGHPYIDMNSRLVYDP